ncbi:MAG: hypothetical protein ACREQJ_00110, partial [Candidatus Binatia bacterium]
MFRSLTIVAVTLSLAACANLEARRSSAPLFSDAVARDRLDFETHMVGRAPNGFAGDTTEFAVADSPNAASGELVVVHRGGKAASLTLQPQNAAEGAGANKELRGEAAVRVMIGEPGAGVACEASDGSGYLVRVEPDAKRVALYERSVGDLKLVAESPSTVGKGSWARLGIRCGRGQVTAYLDGAPLVSKSAEVEL